ncbi:hypothetical protein BKA65DRAFT_39760 [Rhexocercosporidium sp. MPI-PUGE-AT-0058]|nr:hypothetical protein BKA65DRAFT_39760 [Rhexocercosporidium sp. MPI-PUGE-AT-0058]
MPISHSPTLPFLSTLIATIFISFGLNALIRPLHALSFFELYPSSTTPTTHDAKLLTALLAIYGIRNIFMGVAISIAAYYSKASTGANGYGRRVLGMLVGAAGWLLLRMGCL